VLEKMTIFVTEIWKPPAHLCGMTIFACDALLINGFGSSPANIKKKIVRHDHIWAFSLKGKSV
jgi:hypothetical protein